MNHPDSTSNVARIMGGRVRAAREAISLTQQQLTDALGFADRQTLSAIENGNRRVQAAELVQLSQVLRRSIDWFIDPFVIAGEANFSWRVSKTLPDSTLEDFELHIGHVVGLFRHLRVVLKGPSKAITQILRLPQRATFEDAWEAGEAVTKELDLGLIPAELLAERVESRLAIPVLFIDADIGSSPNEISGAMCRLHDLEVIMINRRESRVRRNYDLAHELFHALTWDALQPEHRENAEESEAQPQVHKRRIEQLADNFASAVLMPKSSLTHFIDPARYGDPRHLTEVASQLQVSTQALAYRLYNLKMIDQPTCLALCKPNGATPRCKADTPKLLSGSFVSLLHDGIARGHISARKAAKALSMTLDQLAELMREHEKNVPFAI